MRGVREGGRKFSMEKWNPERVIECSVFLTLWLVAFLGNSHWDGGRENGILGRDVWGKWLLSTLPAVSR